MSTKTNFKRVALVAVAALGLGVLTSIAPASATDYATTNLSLTTSAAGVANAGLCTTTAATSAAVARVIAVGGSQQFTLATATNGRIEITGNGKFRAAPTAGTLDSTAKVLTITAASSLAILEVTGTGVITVATYADDTTTTVVDTFYFSGTAACGSGVSVAKSHAQVNTHATNILTLTQQAAGTASSSGTSNSTTAMDNSNDENTYFANGDTVYIHLELNDAYGVSYTTSSTLSVSCTNNMTVGGNTGGYYANGSFTAGYANISVAQPTAGTPVKTTCTVSLNNTVLATKSFTIMGDIATVEAELNRIGDAETPASGRIKYKYKDSAGNTLSAGSNTPSLTSSTITTITNAIASSTAAVGLDGAAAAQTSGYVTFNCLDFGTSNLTVYVVNNSVATITSPVVGAVCGGPTYTYAASLDKASYATGDVATLTITAKDYNGSPVAYGTTLGTGASVALGGMTAASTIATTDTATDALKGTWVYQFTVGQTTGSYSGSVKMNIGSAYAIYSALYGKAATVSYKITDSSGSVSNADVLKAIVSLIASINKQIAALQKALLKK